MKLSLSSVAPPETEDSVFRTVGHVDQPLVEPSISNDPTDCADHQAVVTDLHEEKVSGRVGAAVDGEGLSVDLSGGELLQVDVIGRELGDLVQQQVDLLTVDQADVTLA